ncbi:CmpA/NrtA family ABC transporter substrate-binding protein [Bosea psychrotolerans]|uniref:NitT/TauT family transport system ATP-binding protein n=1 Tax=Bosea psychrotolerans TaxID=1871628 RepID=A0A2S4M0L6_9HYPH|nr:CmpA/NrtA family ABC transporter substrate-binding protein [Bosea psychrotolerans]POR48262.1 NitT/TauT family transport system ATP-binding protein [Bosea psychrotolerans]
MTLHLRVGFMPLVDCALVILAKDEGFAEAEGLNLELVREVSWSNLRDKLNVRLLDAAHMLGPAAVAATLGIGGVKAPMAVPIALNLDGSAITVSLRRFEEMARLGDGDMADPAVSARALAAMVVRRKASGLPPLTFAAVFGFSSHTYLLCEWMAKGGIKLGEDVRFEVVPPPQTVEALTSGRVDGFCAGAPYSATAVAAGIGAMLHCGVDLRRNCPEKVLAWRADDAERRAAAVAKLNAAILRASDWACQPANFGRLALHLSKPDRLALPADILEPVLHWELLQGAGRPPRKVERFIRFDREALRPDPEHANWILAGMEQAGQIIRSPEMTEQAKAVFRPALFAGSGNRI